MDLAYYQKVRIMNFRLIFTHLILTMFCLIIILPLLWILRTSFAEKVTAYKLPPDLFFTPTLDNYKVIFEKFDFDKFFFNSLFIAGLTTIISLVLGALAAYSIERFKTGGKIMPVAILSTQMLPPITLVIPFFLLFKFFGLTNTYMGLLVAYLTFNLPYVMMILISFLQGIPKELDEAGVVDGYSPLQTYFYIVLPATLPGVGAAAMLSFVLCWNEFIFALMLAGQDTKTLPVAISSLVTQQGTAIGAVSAATILAILPMVIMFFIIRKVMVSGLSFGAVKG